MLPSDPNNPFSKFGQPPLDAVTDVDALAEILVKPIFEDVDDIPKLASGMLDVTGRVPYEGGMAASNGVPGEAGPGEGEAIDEEALAMEILDRASRSKSNAMTLQDKAREETAEEEMESEHSQQNMQPRRGF